MLNLPNPWSKMQAVYRCRSYFSWVSEFWLALPALIGREFLQNLWFKDEAGGDSPIVHILFFLFAEIYIKVEHRKMLRTTVKNALSENT